MALGIKLGEGGEKKKQRELRNLRNAWSMPKACAKMKRGENGSDLFLLNLYSTCLRGSLKTCNSQKCVSQL